MVCGIGGVTTSDAIIQQRIDTRPTGTRGNSGSRMVVGGQKGMFPDARVHEPNGKIVGGVMRI